MTGAYPWKISNDFKSIAYVTNITDDQVEFVTEVSYEGGKFTLGPRKLQPRETAVFDIAKIREEQTKDLAGQALPSDISQGQFKWAVRGLTNNKIVLIGRTEMVSRSQKISSSYSCPMDCGPIYEATATIPDELGIGDSGSASVTETASWNYGYTMGPYAASAGWSVDNPIASFDPSGGSDTTITGTDVGSANVSAVIGWQESYDWDGLECVDRGSYLEEALSELGIGPIVATVQPSSAAPGTLVPVAIAGYGFHDGSTVSVSSGGVSVIGAHVVTSVLIVATFSVSPIAIPGTYSVGVTSAGRHSIFNGVFHVRVPDHLVVISDTANQFIEGNCGAPNEPRARAIKFQVVDSGGDDVGIVTIKENFASLSFNTCRGDGRGPDPDACDYLLSTDGTFTDKTTVGCGNTGGSCGYNLVNNLQWCPLGGAPHTLATLTETIHYDQITVNGNTAGFSPGYIP